MYIFPDVSLWCVAEAPMVGCEACDSYVIESEDQLYLNTGIVYAPSLWLATSWSRPGSSSSGGAPFPIVESVFDAKHMSGVTLER